MSVLKWELYPPTYTTLQVGWRPGWIKDQSILSYLLSINAPAKIEEQRRQGGCGRTQGAADPGWRLPCTAFGQVAAQWALIPSIEVFGRFELQRGSLCIFFSFAHFRNCAFVFPSHTCVYILQIQVLQVHACGDMLICKYIC